MRTAFARTRSRTSLNLARRPRLWVEACEARRLLAAAVTEVGFDLATRTEHADLVEHGPALSTRSTPGVGVGSTLLEPTLTGEVVFGTDQRILVGPNPGAPYRMAVKIYITFPSGGTFIGSGSMISPYHVLTAGHVMYDAGEGGWATSMQLQPGKDLNNIPYGEANATYFRTYGNWTSSADINHDWGLVTLDRRIGNFTGWFGYQWRGNSAEYNGLAISTAGYPGDLNSGERMYRAHGPSSYAETSRIFYNGSLDTAGGQSGSGVWSDVGQYINGVHAYGGATHNSATRITEQKFNSLGAWVTEDNTARPPTDRPDLADSDRFFVQNTATLSRYSAYNGQTVNVSARIINGGTANAGAFNVNFYASTNNIISSGDTLLQSVSVSSLGALASTTLNPTVRLPYSLAGGNYYIGWMIDSGNSQVEFLEGNNTGFVTSQLALTRIAADSFEPNDSIFSPTQMGNADFFSTTGRTIHDYQNDDYYRFVAAANGSVTVDASFLHGIGDVDISLQTVVDGVIAQSTGTTNAESFTAAVVAGETYFVRVYGFNGAVSNDYSLTVNAPAPVALTTVSSSAFAFETSQYMQFNFSGSMQPVGPSAMELVNLTTGVTVPGGNLAVSWPNASTARVSYTPGGTIFPDGEYRLRLLSGALLDVNGNALDGDANSTAGGNHDAFFHTLAGDANRDKRVNFADLVILAQHYNTSGKPFSLGNFNYDANVNFADLVILAQRYNTSLIGPPPAAESFGSALNSTRIARAIPTSDALKADDVTTSLAATKNRKRIAVALLE